LSVVNSVGIKVGGLHAWLCNNTLPTFTNTCSNDDSISLCTKTTWCMILQQVLDTFYEHMCGFRQKRGRVLLLPLADQWQLWNSEGCRMLAWKARFMSLSCNRQAAV
jgi:hypothetical protein